MTKSKGLILLTLLGSLLDFISSEQVYQSSTGFTVFSTSPDILDTLVVSIRNSFATVLRF